LQSLPVAAQEKATELGDDLLILERGKPSFSLCLFMESLYFPVIAAEI
jgi:hypothetical protein